MDRDYKDPKYHNDTKRKQKYVPQFRQVTTLFESKQEMIIYVNEKGQEGHKIDIFKIEDGLYKVVVIMKEPRRERL